MSTPRTGSVHTLKPVGLLDVADKRVGDHAGHRVRVVQPGQGAPKNGAMGHCYVECLECGAEPQLAYFIGLVLISSLGGEVMSEVQQLHVRLDAAEEAIVRARYLSDEITAEYADAGHAYFAALQRTDFASAARIHREHYDTCRPQIRARVQAELVAAGVIRVCADGAWEYLTDPAATRNP